ncbi:DUF3122 domain-containing protein [Aerosakkonemataceae cyanobacterium BLCC-F50]|uniref:DUF3122 domain-containing protein n=1 Tax=Floridaenema flaviceps BLCC-F50 TaxID=3153642 RepID=A0ABV4Y1V8_9CYAN
MEKLVSRFILLCGLVLLFFCIPVNLICPSAIAVLREYQDAPGVMRYQSQHSLRDATGYSWQVILFKQFPPERSPQFILRLVGFPGIVEIAHPQALEITTNSSKLLTATDLLATESPAPNVGQYNVTNLIDQLPHNSFLKLTIPLTDNKNITLKIPKSILIEWEWLATEIE